MASVALGTGLVFYILTWPGLWTGGQSILGHLPSTSGWMAVIAQTLLSAFLLTAVLTHLPDGEVRGVRWLWSVAAWVIFAVFIHVLVLLFENNLLVLVNPNGTFAPIFLGIHWIAVLLFGAGVVLSTRRYLLSGDALIAYVALGQMACASAILMLMIGAKRYDLWWSQRMPKVNLSPFFLSPHAIEDSARCQSGGNYHC